MLKKTVKRVRTSFVFKAYTTDFFSGKIIFYYEIKRGGDTHELTERICFKKPSAKFKKVPQELITQSLNNLFLILGISYWKAYCPKKIIIRAFSLSRDEAQFWNST